MKREIRLYSSVKNGSAEPQIFFVKIIEVSQTSILPQDGSIVPPGCIAPKKWKQYDLQPGNVTDARIINGTQIVCVATPTHHHYLSGCLREEGGYTEVAGSPR